MTLDRYQKLNFAVALAVLLLAIPLAFAVRAEDYALLESAIASLRERSVLVSTENSDVSLSLLENLEDSRHYCCTGVIIEKNLVLTTAHVLRSGDQIFVDGNRAEIAKRSMEDDLLLLHVATKDLPRLKLKERLGSTERAFYVGNPRYHRGSVFSGKIVQMDGRFVYSDCFKDMDAAMGASGSGLYSVNGELIGLKKGMLPGANGSPPLSVAIPAFRIREFLE